MESEIFYTEDNECFELSQRKVCKRNHKRPTSTNGSSTGKTFGCSWEEYRKVSPLLITRTESLEWIFRSLMKIQALEHTLPSTSRDPKGTHSTQSNLKKDSSRLTSFNQLFDRQIPPLTIYDPTPLKVTKHSEPTASKSQRIDLAKPLNDNPSAAHYNLKRFLD